jgi:hypothetical protein
MANVLLDILRSMAVGAAADKAREKASPYLDDALQALQPAQEAITPGARMIDGYPSMSSGLEAITAPYQPNRGFTAEAADPAVVQQMVEEAYKEQLLRQSEVDADIAAENAANAQGVQDFVRKASGTRPVTELPSEMELMKKLDPKKVEQAGITPQEAFKMAQAAGAINLVPEAVRVAEETGDESILDSVTGWFSELFGNEQKMLALALGFNRLSSRPSAAFDKYGYERMETLQSAGSVNDIAKQLREMGYPQWADYVIKNPKMAPKLMEQIMQKELKPGAATKVSGVQTDPVTGQLFTVQTDPATGKSTRVNVEGAIGMTPKAKSDLEAATASNTLDQKTAIEYGQKVFDQAQSINGQIGRLQEISNSIDAGAVTGPVSQFLPTISKATAQLEAAANSLGIDIINSATFGALSEAELRLALSTGLPQGLPEDELQLWVKDKIAAQKKLRDELFRQAQTLMSGGVRYTEWASNFAKQALEKSAQESAPAQAPVARPAAPAVQSSDDGFTVKEIR